MAKTLSGTRAILAPAARRDIKGLPRWSEDKSGKEAALRYEALLIQAIRDIGADAARPGVSRRPDVPGNVLLYHLSFSRRRLADETVKEPRHFWPSG